MLDKKEELSCKELIEYTSLFYKLGFRKFKLMGGEPTLRKDLIDIIKGIREHAPQADISMITNGYSIKNKVQNYINSGLNRINVSIHDWTLTQHYGTTLNIENNLNELQNSILCLKEKDMLSKVNFVIQKGKNEEETLDLIKWCGKYNLTLDILNMLYNPETQDSLQKFHYTFSEIKKFIVEHFKVDSIKIYNNNYSLPSTRLLLKNGCQINLKTSELNKQMVFNACDKCSNFNFCTEGIKAIRLSNNGIIQPCLFRNDNSFDLRTLYNNHNLISDKLVEYLDKL